MAKPLLLRAARLAPGAVLAAALLGAPAAGAESPEAGWVPFEASLLASGQRQALKAGPFEAATTHLSGSIVVQRGEGLRTGFRGEALLYGDGRDGGVGTLVLTDDHGDQIVCGLAGDAAKGGTEVRATIRGGTGRYEGIAGEFTFVWRHLVRTPDGEVSGGSEKAVGRFRLPPGASKARPAERR